MNGKVNALVGDLGAGKTTYIRNFVEKCKGRNVLCYLRIGSDFHIPGAKIYTDFLEFIKAAIKAVDSILIIDEAYTCLPKKLNIKLGKPSDPHNMLADILVNSRKLNNFIFIIFHSLSQIPTEWLVPYLDYIIRFITNDMLNVQAVRFKSFPSIVNNLLNVRINKKFEKSILKLR